MNRRRRWLVFIGTAVAVFLVLLGSLVPALEFLNAPGFLLALFLFSSGHDIGPLFIPAGIVFNAALFSVLLIVADKVLTSRRR